ncbi:hypothetical protein HYALB_00009984 [Hymenoscyphus albidus]|uniref:Biotrophy-associated secreted protein 2 n=1 Tax=Hymenoscyphus albidus TaxID=595503 RepID=A0A9N9LYS5_9HELO|nr:hypothetical protein HYALB_00009984 [Hymenoscyphus albidus]
MVRISFAVVLAFTSAVLAVTPNAAGSKNVGTGKGEQFITGGCTSNADCSSKCCAGNPEVGVCSAEPAALQAGKTGCGFVDPNPEKTIAAAKAQVAKQGFRRSPVA